jgi:hypothetical protein
MFSLREPELDITLPLCGIHLASGDLKDATERRLAVSTTRRVHFESRGHLPGS